MVESLLLKSYTWKSSFPMNGGGFINMPQTQVSTNASDGYVLITFAFHGIIVS